MKDGDGGSESEFEDALDSLPSPRCESDRVILTSYAESSTMTTNNFDATPFSSQAGEQQHRSAIFPSSSSSTGIQSDNPGIRLVSNTTRHGRLELLRNRMRQEFGQPAGSEDAVSDCTSLASWGRNLLMEQATGDSNTLSHGCLTVKPMDSLSTRATPAPSSMGAQDSDKSASSYFLFDKAYSVGASNNENYKTDESLNLSTAKETEIVSVPHNQEAGSSTQYLQNDRRLSLSPPIHPPPPLPKYLSQFERSNEDVRESIAQSSLPLKPPPLPPRRTTVTLPPALPPGDSPSPTEFVIPVVSPTIDNNESWYTASLKSDGNRPAKQNFQSSQPQQLLQQSNSLSPKRNMSESCSTEENRKFAKNPTFFDDYGMKRGHAKTNSLDRGLSLAKSMKSGPFPPPASSKSNSLKRDIAPNDAMSTVCEEDQRNNTAHGVIQQLTFFVLSSSQHKAEKKFSTGKGLAAVGEEIASVSSSASIPTMTPNTKPRASTNPHYENLTINDSSNVDVIQRSMDTGKNSKSDDERPFSHSQTEGQSSSIGDNSHEENRLSKSNSLPRDRSSTLSLRKSKTLHHMESIDPVTRDVQRRMSLSSADLSQGEGTSASTFAGISHVKNVARSYGTAAVGFLRGAVRRSKTAVASNPISKVISARSDYPDAGSSDSGEDEGTTSVSESLPPTVAGEAKIPLPPSATSASAPEVICRPRNTKKGPFDFEQLKLVQELSNEHTGAVWCVKFSVCGRLFATGGQDNIIRVWVLKNYVQYFTRMRERYNRDVDGSASQNSLQEKLSNFMFMGDHFDGSQDDTRSNDAQDSHSSEYLSGRASAADGSTTETDCGGVSSSSPSSTFVMQKPFCVFRGHTADVLDLSWSPRNYFILSCGIDRTVKLWHLTRNECLCCFQHMDFVTCIAFMPKDDRYFISGCMDGKIRLWHIPEKKVALWNEVEQSKFITAITFVRNAKFVVVGTYNGRCFFYTTDQLRYHTVIDVRSSRGKNARGHKITSLAVHGDKLLITSNDSRIRMYDLRDMNLTRKFKGSQIERSQIRASFSPDGRHIISGSEDNYIYLWRTGELPPSISVRKDRNPMWERVRAHNSVVTAAVFAPKPNVFYAAAECTRRGSRDKLLNNVMKASVAQQQAQIHGARNGRSASIASSSGIGLDSGQSTASSSIHNRLMDIHNSQVGANVALSANFTSLMLSNSLSRSRNDGEKLSKMARVKKASDAMMAHDLSSHGSTSMTGGVPSLASSGGIFSAYSRATNGSSSNTSGASETGDVIVSADVSGSLKIFMNPVPLKTGSSSFFPH